MSDSDDFAPIKYGPFTGRNLRPLPYKLDSINDCKDKDVVVSVCAYISAAILTGDYKYIEVDGYDPDTRCWVISAYQVSEEVSSLKLATMVDEFAKYADTRNCILKSTTIPEQWSTHHFKGQKLRGCLRVYICNPKTRSYSSDLMTSKPVESTIMPLFQERSDKYMRSNRSGISKDRSRKPSLDEVNMAITKKRGIINRFWELVGGVSSQDVDKVVEETFSQSV